MEEDEAKRIVESMTDSITSGDKQDMEDSTKEQHTLLTHPFPSPSLSLSIYLSPSLSLFISSNLYIHIYLVVSKLR